MGKAKKYMIVHQPGFALGRWKLAYNFSFITATREENNYN